MNGFTISLITKPINWSDLESIAKDGYGDMAKAVVDIEKKIMAVNAEMHVDEETYLIEQGSSQENLWGVNIHFTEEDWLEFDSMINIRPSQKNRSRYVEDPKIREKIIEIVSRLIIK